MKRLYASTERALKFNASKGFTLIELLVVIAIIAILASLAIPQYMAYQRKAKVSSYAEPIARACIMDYVAWCVENPGQAPPNNLQFNNCKNVSTAGGQVTIEQKQFTACGSGGEPGADSKVVTKLDGVGDYTAECTASPTSVKCTVK